MSGDEYYNVYENVETHRLMLDDKIRTETYRNAIERCKSRIEGKTVLDVGSGTGILSIFCARAGAKKVHAVEASNMAKLSMEIMKENKLSDVVKVHHCPVEDLELEEEVDVIVSEWMGFFLFHEGMLSAVIEARDRFLKRDGFIIPESADLYVAPCRLPKYFDYWDDVYGVNMQSLGKHQRQNQKEPVVTDVALGDIIAEESVVKTVDMKTVTWDDVKEIKMKTLVPVLENTKCQGLCIWFVCNFLLDDDQYLFLSTKPGEPKTHWQQTATVFPFEIEMEKGDPFAFELVLRSRMDDFRKYTMEVTILDPEKEEHPTPCQCSMTRCVIIQKFMEESAKKEEEDILEDCEEEGEG